MRSWAREQDSVQIMEAVTPRSSDLTWERCYIGGFCFCFCCCLRKLIFIGVDKWRGRREIGGSAKE